MQQLTHAHILSVKHLFEFCLKIKSFHPQIYQRLVELLGLSAPDAQAAAVAALYNFAEINTDCRLRLASERWYVTIVLVYTSYFGLDQKNLTVRNIETPCARYVSFVPLYHFMWNVVCLLRNQFIDVGYYVVD